MTLYPPFDPRPVEEHFKAVPIHCALAMTLTDLVRGRAMVTMDKTDGALQQNGFFHAGALTALADSAAGSAGATMLNEAEDILSTNISIALMRAASADKLYAIGQVIKAGRRLIFCEAEIFDSPDESSKLLAKASVTLSRETRA